MCSFYSIAGIKEQSCSEIMKAFQTSMSLQDSRASLILNKKTLLLDTCLDNAREMREQWIKKFLPNKTKATKVLDIKTLKSEFTEAGKENLLSVQQGLIEISLDHAVEQKDSSKALAYLKTAQEFVKKLESSHLSH
jgi:hypothetical protein